jgi:hypothetical protein
MTLSCIIEIMLVNEKKIYFLTPVIVSSLESLYFWLFSSNLVCIEKECNYNNLLLLGVILQLMSFFKIKFLSFRNKSEREKNCCV